MIFQTQMPEVPTPPVFRGRWITICAARGNDEILVQARRNAGHSTCDLLSDYMSFEWKLLWKELPHKIQS
jgi:hypothetical protein